MSTFLLSYFLTFLLSYFSGWKMLGDRKYFVTLQKKSQKLPLCFAAKRLLSYFIVPRIEATCSGLAPRPIAVLQSC